VPCSLNRAVTASFKLEQYYSLTQFTLQTQCFQFILFKKKEKTIVANITIVFKVILPEIFTQSGNNYEALHQGDGVKYLFFYLLLLGKLIRSQTAVMLYFPLIQDSICL
jgi:hypothetical protein